MPDLPSLRKTRVATGDPETDRALGDIQEAVDDVVRPLKDVSVLSGVRVPAKGTITLEPGEPQSIQHKLGRRYGGWNITDRNEVGDIRVSGTTNTLKFITLELDGAAANPVSIVLWVF